MASAHVIRGEMLDVEVPVWTPLKKLLGSDDLCAQFMWMFGVELADGTVLNAYKHIWTRRYFHLADGARTYWYAGDGYYGTVDAAVAIQAVFRDWACAELTTSERLALRAAVRRASRLAP